MVKIGKIQKILEFSGNFQNFGGGFVRIRLQATEHEFLENRAKTPKITIFHRFRPKIHRPKNQISQTGRKIELGMPRPPKKNLTIFL